MEFKNLIKLEKTYNTRHLGSYKTDNNKLTKDFIFIRSDSPEFMTKSDMDKIISLGIDTVIDLRYKREVLQHKNPFKEDNRVKYFFIPLVEDGISAGFSTDSFKSMSILYINIVDNRKEQVKEVFKIISESKKGVFFHCTIGKDRTGVIACLLLLLAGVSEEDIIEDYVISEKLLSPILVNLKKEVESVTGSAEIATTVFASTPDYIEDFIKHIKLNYGSAYNYLLKIGLNDYEISKIKNKMIQ